MFGNFLGLSAFVGATSADITVHGCPFLPKFYAGSNAFPPNNLKNSRSVNGLCLCARWHDAWSIEPRRTAPMFRRNRATDMMSPIDLSHSVRFAHYLFCRGTAATGGSLP